MPQCSLCAHTGVACSYPASAGKPGPKLGKQVWTCQPYEEACSQFNRYVGTVHTNKRRRNTLSTLQRASPIVGAGVLASAPDSQQGNTPQLAQNTRRRTTPLLHLATPPDYAAADRELSWRDIATPHEEPEAGARASDAPAFSQIMYPTHDAQTRPQSPYHCGSHAPSSALTEINVESVCNGLGIPASVYASL